MNYSVNGLSRVNVGRKYTPVSNTRPEEDRHTQPVEKEALFRFR